MVTALALKEVSEQMPFDSWGLYAGENIPISEGNSYYHAPWKPLSRLTA